MKFYSDIEGNVTVWIGRPLRFNDGIYLTDNPEEIKRLKELGYRSDSDGQAEQRNTERQATKTEPTEITKEEIIKALESKGIKHDKRNKKAVLYKLLKEG